MISRLDSHGDRLTLVFGCTSNFSAPDCVLAGLDLEACMYATACHEFPCANESCPEHDFLDEIPSHPVEAFDLDQITT